MQKNYRFSEKDEGAVLITVGVTRVRWLWMGVKKSRSL